MFGDWGGRWNEMKRASDTFARTGAKRKCRTVIQYFR